MSLYTYAGRISTDWPVFISIMNDRHGRKNF
jgi:hypothetical protein